MIFPIVVLAGGLATRLRPLIDKIPKSLVSINGTPFVIHQLELFLHHGINNVHFCLGHLGEMVKEVIEGSKFPDIMEITYSFDGKKPLGTGGAIINAFFTLPETFFITYGDSFLDIDYKAIESYFLNSVYDDCGLMTVYKNANKYDTSNVIFENKCLVSYSKKTLNSSMEYIDYGLGILRKNHFQLYPVSTYLDLSEVYESLSLQGNLIGFESYERFFEIGSIKGIEDFTNYLNSKQL